MSGNEAARTILESLVGFTGAPAGGTTPSQDRPVRMAVVDAGYSGSGNAQVRFDGESTTGLRSYVTVNAVAAGDRVVMIPVGTTYVILGTVGAGGSRPFREAADTVTAVSVATGATNTTAVAFPVGRFTVPPLVLVTVTGGGITYRAAGSAAITTSGFNLLRGNTFTGALSIAATWHAIQMTPAAAAG